MSPADLIADAGRAIYGPEWQGRMAEDLGVSKNQFRRWLTGKAPVPRGTMNDTIKLLYARGTAITQAYHAILAWRKERPRRPEAGS